MQWWNQYTKRSNHWLDADWVFAGAQTQPVSQTVVAGRSASANNAAYTSAGRSARSASQPANSADITHRQASLPLPLRLIRGIISEEASCVVKEDGNQSKDWDNSVHVKEGISVVWEKTVLLKRSYHILGNMTSHLRKGTWGINGNKIGLRQWEIH